MFLKSNRKKSYSDDSFIDRLNRKRAQRKRRYVAVLLLLLCLGGIGGTWYVKGDAWFTSNVADRAKLVGSALGEAWHASVGDLPARLAVSLGMNNKVQAASVITKPIDKNYEPDLRGRKLAENIYADAAILVEYPSGRILFAKNPDMAMSPASMTKMMTGILAIENSKPDDIYVISQRAMEAGENESYMGYSVGDKLTCQELLEGTLLVSDNVGAYAIAEHFGTGQQFADMMNKKAQEIGAGNTHFMNPHGLTQKGHYSTARDMAKIAMYCWQNDEFKRIVGSKSLDIVWTYPQGKADLAESTDDLLWDYPGMNGIKTGWTEAAGGCFAGAAYRDGVQLISIVMHSQDSHTRFSDTVALMDYGFSVVQGRKTAVVAPSTEVNLPEAVTPAKPHKAPRDR